MKSNLTGCFYKKTQGFTLVEIAIVLVIIGLLVGSVLAATDLIQSSRIRSVITDVQRFSEAIGTFQTKYKALPGDMADAENYWGSDSGCPNTTTNTLPKVATCNGNGDGFINGPYYERFRAIQQLSNAGLIPGTFTGTPGPGGTSDSVIGINIPKSRIESAGYTLVYAGPVTGSTTIYDGNFGHAIYFGAANSGSNAASKFPILTSLDAFNIDKKMDDGLPGYGAVVTWKPTSVWVPSCATTSVESTATYAVNTVGRICSLVFKTGF